MTIPCQTVIKENGEVIPGTMDTTAKFNLMTQGIDLKGKLFLDVGCNAGMMCSLASKAGAIPKGIDIDFETVKAARLTFPGIHFQCENAETLSASCDIILASAMLHYVDLDKTLRQFSRCAKQVICDVWLHPSEVPLFALTTRGIYIPSMPSFLNIALKYFKTVDLKGPSLSPDDSKRFIFHLSDPIPNKPEALLISGDGNSGKSTLSYTLGRPVLILDQIIHEWFFYHQGMLQSVSQANTIINGDYWSKHLDFYKLYIINWLSTNRNRDIVVEGYELFIEAKKNIILNLLKAGEVKEVNL